jgi:hypothetical protein
MALFVLCETINNLQSGPLLWILANGKYPRYYRASERCESDVWEKAHSGVPGLGGEKGDFFSILIIEEPVRVRARFRVVQLGGLARPRS